MDALLRVQDLHVQYAVRDGGAVQALRGIHFEIHCGEILGVLGESGCGKTTMARALAGLLSRGARITGGKIEFAGKDPDSSPATISSPAGRVVLISQEPGIALNPVIRVGDQIAEVLRAHNHWDKAKCREEATELLRCVQLDADPKFYDAYPHQISGGQQQRIMIAQALACRPEMLIADEPTASLDEAAEAGILELLKTAVSQRKMALLLITHTPAILTQFAQRVLVMYGGRVIEEASVTELFREPLHPYTKALLQCRNAGLTRAKTRHGVRFSSIEGDAPNLQLPVSGCSFAARCENRMAACTVSSPSEFRVAAERKVECLLYAR